MHRCALLGTERGCCKLCCCKLRLCLEGLRWGGADLGFSQHPQKPRPCVVCHSALCSYRTKHLRKALAAQQGLPQCTFINPQCLQRPWLGIGCYGGQVGKGVMGAILVPPRLAAFQCLV